MSLSKVNYILIIGFAVVFLVGVFGNVLVIYALKYTFCDFLRIFATTSDLKEC